jgi:Periplasmic copper-binding protein (NosD)
MSWLVAAGLTAADLYALAPAWSTVEALEAGAFFAGTAAAAERQPPSGTTLESRTPRAMHAADLAQRSEPALRPPARIDPDALKQARPSRAADSARAPRTLRACPAGVARPDCRHGNLQDALNAALPGDHLILAPGVYAEGAIIGTPGLVLRGEPGAHLRGHAVEGKAALVVKAKGVVIEGIECSGIAVRDNNGACIRIEGDDLTVRNVHFHDNQEGILSGPGGGVLLVEHSLLERNGFAGQAHGVYIGKTIETFVFRNNRILATTGAGHGLKSRARRTIIENNVIAGLEGQDSRAIDLPDGGDVVIRNNVLQKGPNSENAQMIGLALEGALHTVNEILIEGNLLLFDTVPTGMVQSLGQALGLMPARGTVVLSKSPGRVVLRNNMIVGAGEIGEGVIEEGNQFYRNRQEAGLPPYPALPDPAQ